MSSPIYSHTELIAQILDAMRSAGCEPSDPRVIVFGPRTSNARSKAHRFHVAGDKKGSKNGWFIFYDDGLPAGAFGSYKSGVSENWCARREYDLDDAQREQRKNHIAAAHAERQKEEQEIRELAHKKANELWAMGRPVLANHPYLLRKKIPAMGIKQLNTSLMIPVRDSDEVVHSLQFILPDGSKRFLSGGAINGHYCLLGELNASIERILICEGYATGVSLHVATGLAVIVAFDAGNLAPVSVNLRKRYPHAALIFCADDDRWHDDPRHAQIGERKARAAANAVDGFVILPTWDSIATDTKPTDFNDVRVLAGLPNLKAQLARALDQCKPAVRIRQDFERIIAETDDFETLAYSVARQISGSDVPAATATHLLKLISKKINVPLADLRPRDTQKSAETGWEGLIKYTEDGLVKPTLANFVLILNHHPDWQETIVYDEFSGDIIKRNLPPYNNAKLGIWADIDSSKARVWFEDNFDISGNIPTTLIDEAIAVASDHHQVHVVKEYLNPLVWDGTPRLETWTLVYLGAADIPVHRFVGYTWMIGAVKRVYEPGSQFDNVLVLEGKQGIRKSTALATLGIGWHAESITDVGSKDSLMNLRGKWIVEFSELDAISRVESSRMKQHISSRYDVYRPSYGRRSVTIPRQNVFAASCNPEQYLKDETGARRFWPVVCGKIDLERLRNDVDQLWAEALHLYRAGAQTWATADMTFLTEAQEQRFQTDPWEEHIVLNFYGKKQIQVSDVLGYLSVPVSKQTQADKNRVVKILGRLGYHCKVTKIDKKPARIYVHD